MAPATLHPEALTAAYVCGGIPGTPPDPDEVYRRTFARAAGKTADFYRRYPQDRAVVAAIADRLAGGGVTLPDGTPLSVRRFQTLGSDGIGSGRVFGRLRSMIRDRGGERRPGRSVD